MKRLTTIERWGFIFGAMLFVGGLISLIWPKSGLVPHFTNGALGMSPRIEMEYVSVGGARAYGILLMLLGSGIAFVSVYRGKR